MARRHNDETVNYLPNSDNMSIGSIEDYSNVFIILTMQIMNYQKMNAENELPAATDENKETKKVDEKKCRCRWVRQV